MQMVVPKTKGEITITRAELRLILKSEATRYMRIIFRLLAASQLDGYYPAIRAINDRKNDLFRIFSHIDLLACVIKYYVDYESTGKSKPDRLGDGTREALLERLKECAKQMGRAPLMLEMPEEESYMLWLTCGTWNGALRLASIEPLSAEGMKEAVTEYGIRNSSPKVIPKEQVRKLLGGKRKVFDSGEISALNAICETARKLGNAPKRKDLPFEVMSALDKLKGNLPDYLGLMGITLNYDPKLGYESAWKRAKGRRDIFQK